MKFNINDYKGKYVMRCKTEEEAKDFCRVLHEVGRTWLAGGSYLEENYWWDCCSDNTICYNFNEGMRGSTKYYSSGGYTILEWSDFMNGKFTKANLKTGDVILRRNGWVEIVNRELGMLIAKDGWNNLDDVKDDLTDRLELHDIVAVRRPTSKGHCVFSAFDNNYGTLVYDRKRDEPEEMTLAEVCKLLGREIKIVQG